MRRLLLALLLLALASPAVAGWNEARTKHFLVYSEQSPAELRAFAERLERFDAAVRTARRMADPPLTDGGKLTIYVLPSVSRVEALVARNVAGFYIGRAGGSLAVVSLEPVTSGRGKVSPEQIFFHEYTHHLVLGDLKAALPSWMIEGFAEFYSTAQVEEGGVVFGAPPQEHATVLLRDLGFSARHLLAGRQPEERFDRTSVYAKGWLLTHYLTFEPTRAGQLASYLAAINSGRPAEAAAAEAFGDLGKLDSELDRYAASKSFRAFRVPAPGRPEVAIRPLTPGEAEMMPVRIRSDRGPLPGRAEELARQARKIAAAHPANASVLGWLAEAEFDARQFGPAVAAADRALALEPGQVQALIYKGRAMMELARAAPAGADWTEIRRLFIRANRADTENAEPLWLFYQSFPAARQAPTADAVKGLLYAHALAPQDRGLRFAAVRQLILDGDFKGAERAFGPIVFDPHLASRRRPVLTQAMDRIRARDSAGALAALEADRRGAPARS